MHIKMSFTPKEILPLLWTPSSDPAVWYLGEVCMDEEHQDTLAFVSDDSSGIPYILFFDKETRKIVRGVSGLIALSNEEVYERADDDEREELMSKAATKLTANIERYEMVHTFD